MLFVQLCAKICITRDRSLNDTWKERNIKQIFQKILLCLYFPLVNIDQIGQNLKCEKGNAKRHDQFKQVISVSDPEKIENRITGLQ